MLHFFYTAKLQKETYMLHLFYTIFLHIDYFGLFCNFAVSKFLLNGYFRANKED
jgi:hypothetical protein